MRSCAEAVLRRTGAVLALLLGMLALPGSAFAQVAQGATTLVVPTPPGGPIDRVARIVAQGLSSVLGEPVVVENKGGAAGKIGVQAALRAARDGHTLIAVSPSIASVNPVVDKAAGYDPLKDFDPLGIVAFNDGVLAVRADLPAADMPGLVAYAKAHPGALTYGSFGVGTSLHLQTEELLHTLGITARHVPYKGEAQAMNALIAGEVDMMAYVTSPIVPFVANGRARALAATASTRWAALPAVPSFAETGIDALRNYTYRSWVGIVLPAGVPAAARQRATAALREVLARPETLKALEAQGFAPVTPDAETMRRTVAAELERNRRLIAAGGISLE
ncbi:Tripartite-type tricarboxylate transporter, receptor component TctC [Variovorax sp. YR634]|uniref:Bug family tripartite tricarboxylate transporter substrate binding protein n=1 Tax=Variovorax sp. YR634 TaxID=1884385 RepID=UPI0008966149|nr:tripartite tricarboxylate transporter substrate binding protein [Variovorax sp. YR634]SDW46381.1 Tripartite-type tricarboxylate transporter, receptor component TctC [Variovorax sp. YR634]